jgi:hypothetical protein
MGAAITELNLVVSRFICHRLVIEDLYRNDADFRTLCADLLLCSKAIRDCEDDMLEKQRVLLEYREIKNELEKDLLVLIESEIKAGTSLHKIP